MPDCQLPKFTGNTQIAYKMSKCPKIVCGGGGGRKRGGGKRKFGG